MYFGCVNSWNTGLMSLNFSQSIYVLPTSPNINVLALQDLHMLIIRSDFFPSIPSISDVYLIGVVMSNFLKAYFTIILIKSINLSPSKSVYSCSISGNISVK